MPSFGSLVSSFNKTVVVWYWLLKLTYIMLHEWHSYDVMWLVCIQSNHITLYEFHSGSILVVITYYYYPCLYACTKFKIHLKLVLSLMIKIINNLYNLDQKLIGNLYFDWLIVHNSSYGLIFINSLLFIICLLVFDINWCTEQVLEKLLCVPLPLQFLF